MSLSVEARAGAAGVGGAGVEDTGADVGAVGVGGEEEDGPALVDGVLLRRRWVVAAGASEVQALDLAVVSAVGADDEDIVGWWLEVIP